MMNEMNDKYLVEAMAKYDNDFELKENQRLYKDRWSGIVYLQEKQKWKDLDGTRHNRWVCIGVVKNNK